ncbi:uncharacterized protein J7T55_010610 [Diaporthe amygdali]|uniref:uncharacterized protein n=1 Tax=Phomopsis amygdali TaxID=1214568 RepID=UPI0022FDF915|nr:uncharacterized protein J7T55_010610 [Diaporthe amygdali]KAJ0115787.1 uncharacterized protein J7T55_010610 [Diaporthe amygdali]
MYFPRWLLATLPLASLSSGQDCYWPNGGTASTLKACSVASSNEAAACCFANHYCMTNGLCLSPTEGTWYRGGCTDEQFQKTGCPKFCDTSDIVGATSDRHVGVWACASRVFACNSLDNCSKQNFTVGSYRAVINAALSTDLFDSGATVTTSITSSTSVSTGAASAASCTSTQQASQGITTGAAAGIGVGVGLPLAIAVGALTFMLIQQPGYTQQPGFNNQQPYTNTSSPWGKPEGHYAPTAEVPGQMVPHELADTQGRHELGR